MAQGAEIGAPDAARHSRRCAASSGV